MPPSHSTDSRVDGATSQPSEEFADESERVHTPVPTNHSLPESVDATSGEQPTQLGDKVPLGTAESGVEVNYGASPTTQGNPVGRQENEVFTDSSNQPLTTHETGQDSAPTFESGSASLSESMVATEAPAPKPSEPVAKAPTQDKPAQEPVRPEPVRNKPANETVTKKQGSPLAGTRTRKRVFKVPTQPIQTKPTEAKQNAEEVFGLNAKSDVFERGE